MQEIEDLSSTIGQTETEIDNLTNEIKDLEGSIEEKQQDLDAKQVMLDERLAATYMNGNNTYLEAFFTDGFFKFVSNYDMIKQIAQYDTELINEVKSVKQSLESEKVKLENAKVESEAKRKELKELKSNKEAKLSSLTDEQKKIQAQIDEYDSQMKQLEAKERALAQQQAASSRSSGSTSTGSYKGGSGSLAWPVPSSSYISSPYGYRIHPISGTKKLHSGTDIAAASGADIVAAESGTVYLASYGYNGGYGNYIIIDHGNGLTTRYAHCSALYVSVGTKVSRGQKIAAVGSTGASTGPHCHFEVRINGASQNPMNYV